MTASGRTHLADIARCICDPLGCEGIECEACWSTDDPLVCNATPEPEQDAENALTYDQAVRAGLVTTCREWISGAVATRCPEPAAFVLWGRFYPTEALGPRCYEHAAEHDPHMVTRPDQYAVIDLRPLWSLRTPPASGTCRHLDPDGCGCDR